MSIITKVFVVSLLCHVILAANIWMFVPTAGHSHKRMFVPLAEGLLKNGHTVTIVSGVASKNISDGLKEVFVRHFFQTLDDISATVLPDLSGTKPHNHKNFIEKMVPLILANCEEMFGLNEIKNLLDGKEKVDLVLLDAFHEDCALAIAHKLEVPFIYMSTAGVNTYFSFNLRIPIPVTHNPFVYSSYPDFMSFWERFSNLREVMEITLYRHFVYVPTLDAYLRNVFGPDLPSILEMERNVSLNFINSHSTMSYPTPMLPNMIEVGGMHCQAAKPLSKDLEEWISGAGDAGVIYFSLGTVVPTYKLHDKYKKIFLTAFSSLPQRILWKFETETLEDLPANVKLSKFLPQQDILGHPSVRLFITHAGLLSFQEGIYHQVPMIAIPIFADQFGNAKKIQSFEIGVELSWSELTSSGLVEAIKTVLGKPRYKENVMERGRLYRDQPVQPLHLATYWVEYLLKHKNMDHMKCSALKLSWYQYLMLDVVFFLMSVTLIGLYVLRYFIKTISKIICPPKDKKKKQKKT